MEGDLRQGQVLHAGERTTCLDIDEITKIMADSRDPSELLDVWAGWHTISPPMRKDFARFVELANKGARELGFKDTGAMWRVEVRHAARRFRQGARPAVGAGAAALPLAARLRAQRSCTRNTATSCRRTARFPRTCSATCGRRTGTTSIRWSRRKTPTPATT